MSDRIRHFDAQVVRNPSGGVILMIAYHFPPIGGSGSLRPLKLAKYLPEYGWKPIVLTVQNPDWYYARDERLLREIVGRARVVRSWMLRSAWIYRLLNPLRLRAVDKVIRRWLMHPDDQIGWIPFGIRKAFSIIREEPIAAVYTTSAPLSSHLIGLMIKKQFGLPWVADFRDEWFENPDLDMPTDWHRRLHFTLERRIVQSADHIVAAAPIFCRLLQKHTEVKKCTPIFMGYDSDDMGAMAADVIANRTLFTVVFTGVFYGSFKPALLIESIYGLASEGLVDTRQIKIRFIGPNDAADLGTTDKDGICSFAGFVHHREALRYISESDVALLLLSEERGTDVVPSKTFEYMGAGKPILALVPPDGTVARIVRESRAGVVADFMDPNAVREAFLTLYRRWERGEVLVSPDRDIIMRYDQRHSTQELASILDRLVHPITA